MRPAPLHCRRWGFRTSRRFGAADPVEDPSEPDLITAVAEPLHRLGEGARPVTAPQGWRGSRAPALAASALTGRAGPG